jgi:glycosyltransferase involved in cell wall biosynthesis
MTTVSIVIPTYKRAPILPVMLAALKSQTFKDFDVIMVVKPSGDGTEELLKQAESSLNIKVLTQQTGHIVDAYFLGAKNSTGDIVSFLDDDAIPAKDWLQETVKAFQNPNIVGVTGDSYPVIINGGKLHILQETEIPSVLSRYEFALWGRPLRGLEDFKNSIATSGVVYERGNNAYSRKHGKTKALLRGPSMAIKGTILRNARLPSDWILGCAWEMMLGWQIWKQGNSMVFSPNVKVYHIVHGRTSSRDFLNPRTDLLWAVEAEMLFYRLYHTEPEFSLTSKLVSDLVRVVHSLKHMKENPKYYLRKIEGIFLGNIIGAKWVIYKTVNMPYSPLVDLKRFQKPVKGETKNV